MTNNFKTINVRDLKANTFELINDDWMLITAGDRNKFNTMTASWGGLGVLWRKDVAFIFVRPQRYTYEFVEKSDFFTLSFFPEKYRPVLNFCGKESGRHVDKIAETGLTIAQDTSQGIYFQEAKLVLKCQKIYYQDLEASHFLSPDIEKLYEDGGYHRLYIGEILECLQKS